MDSNFTAIIAASAALAGSGVTAFIQTRIARRNHLFELEKERIRWAREHAQVQLAERRRRTEQAHRILSVIAREFSITSLCIDWRSGMSDSQYDEKYRQLCRETDELRMSAGLYECNLAHDVDELYGAMNIYWGNFRELLRLTKLGEEIGHDTPCHRNSFNASNEIESKVFALKAKLAALLEDTAGR